MSTELRYRAEDFAIRTDLMRCAHLKKAKQQFWATLHGPAEITCRDCAVPKLQFCTQCGEPATFFYVLDYLRGESGNDPNYFIAASCGKCNYDTGFMNFGVKLLKMKDADNKKYFMAVRLSTCNDIPVAGIPKVKKTKETDE